MHNVKLASGRSVGDQTKQKFPFSLWLELCQLVQAPETETSSSESEKCYFLIVCLQ